ncbi:MAG: glycosyltransferase [Bacteroidota bacterium]|nr:glycosyltransferase [Bacteroidota bacterium]
MKILIVCSGHSGKISPFITEQVNSIKTLGVEADYFFVKKKGLFGYLKERKHLLHKIKAYEPELIHAHYGLSGLLANLQRKVPVVSTYHGSDINDARIYLFSRLCMILSAHNIFVSEKNRTKSGLKSKQSLIPCGVDTQLFIPTVKEQARKKLGLDKAVKYILFAGAFQNKVKNAGLAQAAVVDFPNVELLELKGYSREQVALLMNAVDVVLMTSFTEGSPQFIKEAMACNCPVVSVPAGDVPDVIKNVEGCFMATYAVTNVAEKLKLALDFDKRTAGRQRIIELGLSAETVAKRILEVYELVNS